MKNKIEMTFFEHLAELRYRILKVVFSLFSFTVIGFYLSDSILYFIIEPLLDLAQKYQNTEVIITDFTAVFLNKLTVSIFFGFIITLPVLLYEVFMFIIPAFNKKIHFVSILLFITVSCLFFIVGIMFSYFIIAPISLDFFHKIAYNFSSVRMSENTMLQYYSINNYYSYILRLSMISGIIFELPVLINILVYIGILNITQLKKIRRYLYLLFFIIASILTPPDIISQLLIAFPLILLYEFSIIIAYFFNRSVND